MLMEVDKEESREEADKDPLKSLIDLLMVCVSANGNFSHLFLARS
ncbi:unnamed protein product [Rhodiola kirilowii]